MLSPFLQLPPELLSLIFRWLDSKSFCAVRTSSKFFFELTQKLIPSLSLLRWNQIRWVQRNTKEMCDNHGNIFVDQCLFLQSLVELDEVSYCAIDHLRSSQDDLLTDYNILLTLLWNHTMNIHSIVGEIVIKRRIIADNFELLDFAFADISRNCAICSHSPLTSFLSLAFLPFGGKKNLTRTHSKSGLICLETNIWYLSISFSPRRKSTCNNSRIKEDVTLHFVQIFRKMTL